MAQNNSILETLEIIKQGLRVHLSCGLIRATASPVQPEHRAFLPPPEARIPKQRHGIPKVRCFTWKLGFYLISIRERPTSEMKRFADYKQGRQIFGDFFSQNFFRVKIQFFRCRKV